MPPSRQGVGAKKLAVEGGEDRLSELPDGPLQYVLSFLPSRDAVRTCVLGRRWREQWKHVGALRVAYSDDYESANALNKFVNYMLVLRDQIPLHVAEIKSYDGDDLEESLRYIEVWICYALSLEVKVLHVCITSCEILLEEDNMQYWLLPSTLITSKTLTMIELIHVESDYPSLDFSNCPALKYLKMEICNLFTDKISSPSVEHLCLTYCRFKEDDRTQITVPNLISLELVDCRGRTPLLQSMPFLLSAFVRLRYCSDYCVNCRETGDCGDGSCEGCAANTGNKTCILFEGLSRSTSLELTAKTTMFVFRKDLTQCPVFKKLKTLLLNDWCITMNLGALICFLQHSPSLEKLILQLEEISEGLVETGSSYDVKKQPLSMKHLIIEVRCQKLDERIGKIIEVLCAHVPRDQIKIKQLPEQIKSRSDELWPAGSLSFEQKRT
ncbi:hypothetical protein ACP70R_003727 [Stipagrostis hirtigluma subsp. patula]